MAVVLLTSVVPVLSASPLLAARLQSAVVMLVPETESGTSMISPAMSARPSLTMNSTVSPPPPSAACAGECDDSRVVVTNDYDFYSRKSSEKLAKITRKLIVNNLFAVSVELGKAAKPIPLLISPVTERNRTLLFTRSR